MVTDFEKQKPVSNTYRENWERVFGSLRAERAAIIEFDGKMPRAEVERRALLEYPPCDAFTNTYSNEC